MKRYEYRDAKVCNSLAPAKTNSLALTAALTVKPGKLQSRQFLQVYSLVPISRIGCSNIISSSIIMLIEVGISPCTPIVSTRAIISFSNQNIFLYYSFNCQSTIIHIITSIFDFRCDCIVININASSEVGRPILSRWHPTAKHNQSPSPVIFKGGPIFA